jgi:hypothetical protein
MNVSIELSQQPLGINTPLEGSPSNQKCSVYWVPFQDWSQCISADSCHLNLMILGVLFLGSVLLEGALQQYLWPHACPKDPIACMGETSAKS